MTKNKIPIATVEYYYNGEEKSFSDFLKSVIRDYVNEDNVSPDEPVKEKKKGALLPFSLIMDFKLAGQTGRRYQVCQPRCRS